MSTRNLLLTLACLLTAACAPVAEDTTGEPEIDPERWGDWTLAGQLPESGSNEGAPRMPDGEYLVLGDGRMYRYTGPGRLPEDLFDGEAIGFQADRGEGAAPDEGPGTTHQAVVYGADGRTVLDDSQSLRSYPARTVGSILYSEDAGSGGCTGTMIGPRHVLTAAHCLHDGQGQWFWPLYFSPGHKGTGADRTPNGRPRKAIARYARTYAEAWDYGLVVLEDEPRTARLGWMGFGFFKTDAAYTDRTVSVWGYPMADQLCADSPLADGTCGGFLYQDTCRIRKVDATSVYYDCDTQAGNSGSAVHALVGGQPWAMGVHKRGRDGLSLNLGPRFTDAKVNRDLCTWISEFPSAYASHACD